MEGNGERGRKWVMAHDWKYHWCCCKMSISGHWHVARNRPQERVCECVRVRCAAPFIHQPRTQDTQPSASSRPPPPPRIAKPLKTRLSSQLLMPKRMTRTAGKSSNTKQGVAAQSNETDEQQLEKQQAFVSQVRVLACALVAEEEGTLQAVAHNQSC